MFVMMFRFPPNHFWVHHREHQPLRAAPDQEHEQKARVLSRGHSGPAPVPREHWAPPRGRHPRFLATIDLSALYSNIQREDGIEAVRKALENVPADFILELLDLDLVKYCTAYLSYLSPISVTCCQVTGTNIFCRHPLALPDHGNNPKPEPETGDVRLAELKKMLTP